MIGKTKMFITPKIEQLERMNEIALVLNDMSDVNNIDDLVEEHTLLQSDIKDEKISIYNISQRINKLVEKINNEQ
jgi:hypothetical protein